MFFRDERLSDLIGFDYLPVPTSGKGDKETRARPFRSQVEAGNVYLVRGPWNEAFLAELEAFPNAVHDDQVDATSCAFNDLATGVRPVKVTKARWG
mgnify:CR=1 FL=1